MKRIRSACILQTLVFSQKPEMGYTKEQALGLNRREFEAYKESLVRTKTRHIIVDSAETEEGSIVIHVKKQYSDNTDVSEYFN